MFSFLLLQENMWPLKLNNLSHAADEACTLRYFLANTAKLGKLFSCFFQNTSGSVEGLQSLTTASNSSSMDSTLSFCLVLNSLYRMYLLLELMGFSVSIGISLALSTSCSLTSSTASTNLLK